MLRELNDRFPINVLHYQGKNIVRVGLQPNMIYYLYDYESDLSAIDGKHTKICTDYVYVIWIPTIGLDIFSVREYNPAKIMYSHLNEEITVITKRKPFGDEVYRVMSVSEIDVISYGVTLYDEK